MVEERQMPSPFAPGFNRAPPVLAGRDEVLDGIDEALAEAAEDRRAPAPVVIVGPRGTGKTVLLGEAAARAAERHGWPRVHVEITSGTAFTSALVASATEALTVLDAPRQRVRRSETILGAQLGGLGAEMHFTAPPAASDSPEMQLRRALRAVVGRAEQLDAGFVLTVDEIQSADKVELGRLAALVQEGTGQDWPVVVAVAGLVEIRNRDRAVTYLERGMWFEVGSLSAGDTEAALQVAAERAGRPFRPDALDYLAGQSGGYPYAIQVYGHYAWRASTGRPTIDLEAARRGALIAERRLNAGLYANRWAQASPKERDYLAAVAALAASEAPSGASVARALHQSTRSVSYLRDSLIKKGILGVFEDRLGFTVPGMADWVRHRVRDDHLGRDKTIRQRSAARRGPGLER